MTPTIVPLDVLKWAKKDPEHERKEREVTSIEVYYE